MSSGEQPPVTEDLHHPFHYKQEWLLRPQAEFIRNTIVARNLARTAHNALHAECTPVPVPGYHTLFRVARRLPSGLDVFEGIDAYCGLVEESNEHPNIKPIEINLNNLSIEAIRAQLPLLHDGMPSTRRVIT